MTRRFKKFNLIILSVVLIAAALYGWFSLRKTSLIDLQKAILVADTDAERQKILDKLDEYYLKMSIPDSIHQHIQAAVDTLVKHQAQSQPLTMIDVELDTNVYQVEIDLKRIIREAMIARIRIDHSTFQALMHDAHAAADYVDIKTGNDYWRPWVAAIESIDATQAMNWLMADRAERLCTRYHLSMEKFNDAEKYGARCLQLLKKVHDDRIRFDVMQRLMTILYRSRGMYDLSLPFAQRIIEKADQIQYHLRATGMTYNYAEALNNMGENHQALKAYWETINRSEKYGKVPDIDWYRRNGLLGVARSNWQLGNYQQTLSLCAKIEQLNLKSGEQVLLHITKGISYRYLVKYEAAEAEYNQALHIAQFIEDLDNQILTLRNLGDLCHHLTEYDKAIAFYNRAIALQEKYNQKNIIRRGELLICIAETKAQQGEIAEYNYFINTVHNLANNVNAPIVKADLFRSIGRLNKKLEKFQPANDNFQHALAIYKYSGLLRELLETNNDLVDCLIGLSKYSQAKEVLNEIYDTATQIHDSQARINALGKMAEIAYIEGDIDQAIEYSNSILKENEILINQFTNIDNLTAFQQKINHYLKNAVIYEIEKGRVDSAFVKLDYIKAKAFKRKIESNHRKLKDHDAIHFMNLEILKTLLKENQLVINYLTTEDTLYAFILSHNKLELLKKAVHSADLKRLVESFMAQINKTITVFDRQKCTTFTTHYDSTIAFSQGLYQELMGWKELQNLLQQTDITYIVPDDILYEVPFSSLLTSSEIDTQFLIYQTAIVNLPSAVFLLSEKYKSNQELRGKRILISINQNFPGAAELIDFIKNQFQFVEELTVEKSIVQKEDILAKLNSGYDIYFFLGHSVPNLRFPDSSFFELTVKHQADGSTIPVKVYLADFEQIDWSKAETVFLIGCETATGKAYLGTGLAGIQQGILLLGAKEVIASMWKIDARNTNAQILNYLKYWKQNNCSAYALQEVQIKTIEWLQHDRYYQKPHPYIWGSFTLSQITNYQ